MVASSRGRRRNRRRPERWRGIPAHGGGESEVYFTVIAHRYGPRWSGMTSNLFTSKRRNGIASPMATVAIDQMMHQSVIFDFDVPS